MPFLRHAVLRSDQWQIFSFVWTLPDGDVTCDTGLEIQLRPLKAVSGHGMRLGNGMEASNMPGGGEATGFRRSPVNDGGD